MYALCYHEPLTPSAPNPRVEATGFYALVREFAVGIGPFSSPVDARREGQDYPCSLSCCGTTNVDVVYRRLGTPLWGVADSEDSE